MAEKHIKIKFPLWSFLNQPIFNSQIKLILNPKHFAYVYRVQLLEKCWDKEYNSKGRPCN